MQRAGGCSTGGAELLQQCLLSVRALLVQHANWPQVCGSNPGAQTCAHARSDLPEVGTIRNQWVVV
jgi:hypothetical protein